MSAEHPPRTRDVLISPSEILSGATPTPEFKRSPSLDALLSLYPEYEREYERFIETATRLKKDLENQARSTFPHLPESAALSERIQYLFKAQVQQTLDESIADVKEIDAEMERLLIAHENYEENLLDDLSIHDSYALEGRTPEETILPKNEILSRFDNPERGTFRFQEKHEILHQKLLAEAKSLGSKLSEIDTSFFIFTSAFKALSEDGITIPLNEINGARFTTEHGGAITQEEHGQMRAIYTQNQQASPALGDLLAAFETNIQKGVSIYSVCTKKYKAL
jgi:hypothetical protein